MKFTDADKIELVKRIAPAVVALRPTRSPPARDGSAKEVSSDFAIAVWTKRIVETIVKVCEGEESKGNGSEHRGL